MGEEGVGEEGEGLVLDQEEVGGAFEGVEGEEARRLCGGC